MYALDSEDEEIPMPAMPAERIQAIIEAALMVAGRPLTVASLLALFPEEEQITNADIKDALSALQSQREQSGIELKEVASGFRFQAKAEFSQWLARLWEERAPRYSRAFLETISIIAYKQPITRAEIEEIRGVTVSTHIIKTLQEREWIRVIGYRDVPGKPAIYGTTKDFLDYFNVKSLADLPTLAEFKTLEAQEEQLQVQLALEKSAIGPSDSEVIPEEREAIINEEHEENNVVAINDSIAIETLEDSPFEETPAPLHEVENSQEDMEEEVVA
jgi:segregation and condensation protein B